jgi:hypothetical protein
LVEREPFAWEPFVWALFEGGSERPSPPYSRGAGSWEAGLGALFWSDPASAPRSNASTPSRRRPTVPSSSFDASDTSVTPAGDSWAAVGAKIRLDQKQLVSRGEGTVISLI